MMNFPGRRSHHGSALLLVLFLMAFTAPLVLLMLDSYTSQIRCARNSIEHAKALYIAQAGAHDAIGLLLADPAWRTASYTAEFPAGSGNTYDLEIVDAPQEGIAINATGYTAAGAVKTITCVVSGF